MAGLYVEPNVTSGDFLHGFYLGTRQALAESGRESITITVNEVSAFSVGLLIALFERAVGLYANIININAYHQPGVEAGKKAAGNVISTQLAILALLSSQPRKQYSLAEIAREMKAEQDLELIFKICEHLAANSQHQVKKVYGASLFQATYGSA